jgi:hypothetical protein
MQGLQKAQETSYRKEIGLNKVFAYSLHVTFLVDASVNNKMNSNINSETMGKVAKLKLIRIYYTKLLGMNGRKVIVVEMKCYFFL